MVTTTDGKIRHYIIFGGVSTADYRCYCDGAEAFKAPERDKETISIPGRNGDLTFDNGRFKDVSVKYPLFFEDIREYNDFKNRVSALRGAQRFEDSHNPYEYRYASLSGTLEPSTGGYLHEYCSVEMNLTLYPQRYLLTGDEERTFTSSGSIYNPTTFASKPLVKVTGTGNVTINGVIIYFAKSHSPIYVDCEMMDAYYISSGVNANANGDITLTSGDFWTLAPGDNTITKGSGITSIIIQPRWWTV